VLPIALGLLAPLLFIFNKKFRAGIVLRLQNQKMNQNVSGPTLWIHCASGEFEYAKSILRHVKKTHPQTKILVSFFSPSYKAQIEKNPLVDYSQILPLDLAGPLQSFIKKYQPTALLIARSDLWPELLKQCHDHNIPTLLFSHTKSYARPLTKVFEKTLYELLTDIYVVSASDQAALNEITSRPTTVAGDTRYDQVLFRLQTQSPHSKAGILKDRRFFIAGSTWPEDEEPLINALILTESSFDTVIVPHESTSEHLIDLERRIQEAGLKSVRFSQVQSWPEKTILLIDETGWLADLYAHCQFAFVGGSFKKKVHSVMEPLGASKPVIVGPFYKNNREAIEFSKVQLEPHVNAVSIAQNGDDLKNLLLKINQLQDLQSHKTAAIIQNEFIKKTGATQEIIKWLQHKGVLS